MIRAAPVAAISFTQKEKENSKKGNLATMPERGPSLFSHPIKQPQCDTWEYKKGTDSAIFFSCESAFYLTNAKEIVGLK